MIKPIKFFLKPYILEINVSATTVTKNCVKLFAKVVDGKTTLEDVSFWYKKLSDLKLLEGCLQQLGMKPSEEELQQPGIQYVKEVEGQVIEEVAVEEEGDLEEGVDDECLEEEEEEEEGEEEELFDSGEEGEGIEDMI